MLRQRRHNRIAYFLVDTTNLEQYGGREPSLYSRKFPPLQDICKTKLLVRRRPREVLAHLYYTLAL